MRFDPLDLDNQSDYRKWRDGKLRAYDNAAHQNIIDIEGAELSSNEQAEIVKACQHYNYAIYRLQNAELSSKQLVHKMGLSLGLQRLDGNLCSDEDNISSIQVKNEGRHKGYIPYTNKPLTWHTDGYYNEPNRAIRAMVLHCVQPAEIGGENFMLDHEMAYLQLRDEEPHFIRAFKQEDVLTIPPNIENGVEIRGAQSGAVFSTSGADMRLHMRYSARTRNIEWKDDSVTQEALACMKSLFDSQNNPYVITYRMQSGEGIIANNTLHNRATFTDGEEPHLLYRARYYDRVQAVK